MRVIVITGGSRGIGAAIETARRGMGVILTCQGKAVALPPDLGNTGSFAAFRETATR